MKKSLISLLLVIALCIPLPTVAIGTEDIGTEVIPTASSDNVVILIPGIIGSELALADGTKVWVGLGAISGQIECNEVGQTRFPLYPYNDDNYGAIDTYETLYEELNDAFSAQADVKFFAYDWRMSNTTAGQYLKSLISSYSGEIILVAHSMGGLVASEYLRIASSSQRSRTTLITLGTPFTGAPKAVQVMETGEMFPGIAGYATSSYVQNLIRNLPAAYQLLPTTRSSAFIQVNGVDQTNTAAWTIMRQRSWSNIQSGSGVKPMVNTATTFHSNLVPASGQHYSLSAGTSMFFTSVGYTTVQKVNYSLNNGQYSIASYVSTNNGDGTVPATSAQNNLTASDSHVLTFSKKGNHTDFINDTSVIYQIVRYTRAALLGTTVNSTSLSEAEIQPILQENERGWLIGEGLDGRRTRVIIRGSSLPTITKSDGTMCTILGDGVYAGENCNDENYIGVCWPVSNGYQFELLNDEYTMSYSATGDAVDIEVAYMENGYFDSVSMYTIPASDKNSYTLALSNHDIQSARVRTSSNVLVQPKSVASQSVINALNMD